MNDTHTIFISLKKQLKLRQISYVELATRIKMSEANVKRIFSEESCSLARLVQICDAIQVPLAEIVNAAAEIEPSSFVLPKEAEEFFTENLDYFVFYRQLEHGHDVKELVEKNKLSSKDLNRYLKKIEELGLIERQPGDRIKAVHSGYLNLPQTSQLMQKYFRRWIPHFFDRVMSPDKKHFTKVFSTGLSEANRQELIEEIGALVVKYKKRGFIDQSKGSNPFEAVGVCIGLGPYRVGEGKIDDYR